MTEAAADRDARQRPGTGGSEASKAPTGTAPAVRKPRRTDADAGTDTGAGGSGDDGAAAPKAPPAVAPAASDAGSRRLVTAEEVMTRRQRRQVERLRARKVRRVVRHIDAWTVLKVSLLFYLCSYIIGLVSGVILWNVAERAGYIEKVEGFIEDLFAYETFEFLPGTLFTAVALGGAILAIVATGLTALGAVLFNLISDLTGGIRLTMVELPGAKPAVRPRRAARLAAKAVPDDDR